jgi:hypothetical protein
MTNRLDRFHERERIKNKAEKEQRNLSNPGSVYLTVGCNIDWMKLFSPEQQRKIKKKGGLTIWLRM